MRRAGVRGCGVLAAALCQVVPERKAAKYRLHLDIRISGGRAVPIETRRRRVDAEAARLAGLGALLVAVHETEDLDQTDGRR
jgi:hypothetical protein